jgi:hypothetical protein
MDEAWVKLPAPCHSAPLSLLVALLFVKHQPSTQQIFQCLGQDCWWPAEPIGAFNVETILIVSPAPAGGSSNLDLLVFR